MLLLSVFSFALLIQGSALRGLDPDALAFFQPLNARLRRIAGWTMFAILISAMVWLWMVTAQMTGDFLANALAPDQLQLVLTQTHFGRLWELRFALMGALGIGFTICTAVTKRRARRQELKRKSGVQLRGESILKITGGTLSAILLASLAWAGHADAHVGPGRHWHLAGDAIHLLAAGIWPGGLVPMLLLLLHIRKPGNSSAIAAGAKAVRRFSAIAAVMILAMAITGILNSYFLVGHLAAFTSTNYGLVLLAKIVLFGGVAGAAARNRFCLKPKLLGAVNHPTTSGQAEAVTGLIRGILIETALAVAIVILVGVLGVLPPAVH